MEFGKQRASIPKPKTISSMKFTSIKTWAVAVILTTMSCHAQSQPTLVWGRQFGTDKEEYARNHVRDAQGNIYVSGNTYGNMDAENAGFRDGYLTRFDSLGNTQWSRQFGSSGDEDIQWSAIDPDGYIYIIGNTTGDLAGKNMGREDFFVVKYNSGGQKVWTKQFGTDSIDLVQGIFVDKTGYVFVGGATLGTFGKSSSGLQDAFLMKLDRNGTPLFKLQFGTESHDDCAALTVDNQGNIFATGSTFGNLAAPNKGFIDVFTAQFSDDGNLIQYYQYGSDGFDVSTCIRIDNGHNLYIGGTTSGDFGGTQAGNGDCFIMKINPQGTLLWNHQFGTEKNDGVKAIAMNEKITENVLISGLKNLPPAHAYIRMYSKDGDILWEKNIVTENGKEDASGKDVSIDDKGNIVHVGLTGASLYGPQIGSNDVYLIMMK
jgi:hypothetical protein